MDRDTQLRYMIYPLCLAVYFALDEYDIHTPITTLIYTQNPLLEFDDFWYEVINLSISVGQVFVPLIVTYLILNYVLRRPLEKVLLRNRIVFLLLFIAFGFHVYKENSILFSEHGWLVITERFSAFLESTSTVWGRWNQIVAILDMVFVGLFIGSGLLALKQKPEPEEGKEEEIVVEQVQATIPERPLPKPFGRYRK